MVPCCLAKAFSPLLGGKVGVEILQLLGGDEGHLPGQVNLFQGRELPAQFIGGGAHGVHNIPHSILQEGGGALAGGDHPLPVPLVHINAVQVVQLLVPAHGVHVGYQTLAGAETVLVQGIALPFGKTVHNLGLLVQAGHVKSHRPLHTVEVIVEAAAVQHEQRCRDPFQVQCQAKFFLKDRLDQADGLLGVVQPQKAFVVFGNLDRTHSILLLILTKRGSGQALANWLSYSWA